MAKKKATTASRRAGRGARRRCSQKQRMAQGLLQAHVHVKGHGEGDAGKQRLQLGSLLHIAEVSPGLVQVPEDVRAAALQRDKVGLERLLVDGQPDPRPRLCVVRGRVLEAGGARDVV